METITCHVHLAKEDDNLLDSTHYLPDFKPGFLQPPCTSPDDLNEITDAVRGDSSAEE